MNVKLFSWVFIKNELNVNYISNYDYDLGIDYIDGLNYSRIHSLCVGIPLDNEKNLLFGEYGLTYNSGDYFDENSSVWGIGYGNYQYNLNLRLLNASAIELSLRFGLFDKSNDNFWKGVGLFFSMFFNL